MIHKACTITLHLTILSAIAWNYGAHMLDHPVACVFAAFSALVIVRTMLK